MEMKAHRVALLGRAAAHNENIQLERPWVGETTGSSTFQE